MKTIFHGASTRGHADHGWLNAHHTFSFANYYDPDRMGFGALRVLNDDIIAGGMGFGRHPHDNMEIVTIPLQGALHHRDSMGNSGVIERGEIQVMSAGTGIFHSEVNARRDEETRLFQIWVIPNRQGVEPRYGLLRIADGARPNELQQIVSPDPEDAGLWIHQDAWFHLGSFTEDRTISYPMHKAGQGLYLMVVSGEAKVGDKVLGQRDGLGIYDTDEVTIEVKAGSEILLIEVPMRFW